MALTTAILPIIWAVIATGIGILLYKSSTALFESRSATTNRTQRLRLTGSAAIAAAAFCAMWYGTWHVSRYHFESAVDGAYSNAVLVDRLALESLAAAENNDSVACKQSLQALRRANSKVLQSLRLAAKP